MAISDPLEVESIDSLSHMLKIPVEPVLADAEQIKRAIEIRYAASDLEGEDGSINSSVDEIAEVQVRDQGESAMEISEDSQAPIIRLVQVIIAEAIRRRASDIHLEPMDTHLMSLYNRGLISAREAFEKSQSPEEMRKRLQSLGATVEES